MVPSLFSFFDALANDMAQGSLVLCCFDALAKVFINRVGICHIGFLITALGALVGFLNI